MNIILDLIYHGATIDARSYDLRIPRRTNPSIKVDITHLVDQQIEQANERHAKRFRRSDRLPRQPKGSNPP